jgi:hypothetical protein
MSEILVRFAGGATATEGGIVARIATIHAPSCPAWLQPRTGCNCGAEKLWRRFIDTDGADPWAAISRWAERTGQVC